MRPSVVQKLGVLLVLIATSGAIFLFKQRTGNITHSLRSSSGDTIQPGEPSAHQEVSAAESTHKRNFGAVRSVKISPFNLARLVNNNRKQWDKHQLLEGLDLQPIWDDLAIDSDDFQTCEANCEGEISRADLDGNRGKEILLKMVKSLSFCRYLLFKRTKSLPARYRFLGYIDHDFNKYELSRHRVIHNGTKNWLVIRGQTGSGTGFSSYDDTWYEVRPTGIREVLKYTAQAHIAEWPKGLGWYLKSTILRRAVKGVKSAVVRFEVSYSGLNYMTQDYRHLFSKSKTVRFSWDRNLKQFVFAPSVSQSSKREFESVYQLESWSTDNFLKYNLNTLTKIAKGRDVRRKEWLRDYLSLCPDSVAKTALIRALG